MGLEKRVLIVGDINVDVSGKIDRIPEVGNCGFGTFPEIYLGGTGVNTALLLMKLGIAVSLVSSVGNDIFGRRVLEVLKEEGLDTSFILMNSIYKTGLVVVLISENTGERSFIAFRKDCADIHVELSDSTIASILELDHSILLVCGPMICEGRESFETVLRLAAEFKERKDALVFLDPNIRTPTGSIDREIRERYLAFMKYVDVFLPNELELSAIFGDDLTVREILKEFRLKEIWLKRGSKGVLVASEETVMEIPAKVVEAVDTTGAGDVFNAGVMAGYLKGFDLKATAEYAVGLTADYLSHPSRLRLM